MEDLDYKKVLTVRKSVQLGTTSDNRSRMSSKERNQPNGSLNLPSVSTFVLACVVTVDDRRRILS